ncbi:hypothetical protein EVAR_86882_1 [Eumeta japonica]|uniref:Uncharacterized protein n=1 Tax=Eumeta variegata TaxID=151549 RepID=A0A4C1ZK50_EUMVA|nr:hypothetical protein EVAR_86882_1 [Eumeta japonica]
MSSFAVGDLRSRRERCSRAATRSYAHRRSLLVTIGPRETRLSADAEWVLRVRATTRTNTYPSSGVVPLRQGRYGSWRLTSGEMRTRPGRYRVLKFESRDRLESLFFEREKRSPRLRPVVPNETLKGRFDEGTLIKL